MNGGRSLFIIIVVVLLVVAGCAAAMYAWIPEIPFQTLALIFAGFLFLILGAFTKNRKEYYLFLWLFLETLGPNGFKKTIPQSLVMNVYYVLDHADLLLAGLYFVWFLEKTLERRPSLPLPKDCLWALMGLWLACLLSVMNAADKTYSIYQVATVLRGLLVFFYVARHAQNPKLLRGILVVLMLSLAFQANLAILQEVSGGDLGLKQLAIKGINQTQMLNNVGRFYRASGTYPSGNLFSALYLDFLLPTVAACFFITRHRSIRVGLAVLYGLGLVSLVFTLSRGGWLAFGIGGILFWVGLRAVRAPETRFTMAPLLVMALLLIVVLFTNNVASSRLATDDAGSATYRISLMQVALQMIKAHPWLGVGAGNYVEVMHFYDTTSQWVTRVFYSPVHNLYLYLAAESGVPALLFFLLFLLFLFRRSWSVLRAGNSEHRLLTLGLLCGLAAALIHGLFEPVALGDYFIFWLVSGLLVAQGACNHASEAA